LGEWEGDGVLLLRIIDHNSSRKIGEGPINLALSAQKKAKTKTKHHVYEDHS